MRGRVGGYRILVGVSVLPRLWLLITRGLLGVKFLLLRLGG